MSTSVRSEGRAGCRGCCVCPHGPKAIAPQLLSFLAWTCSVSVLASCRYVKVSLRRFQGNRYEENVNNDDENYQDDYLSNNEENYDDVASSENDNNWNDYYSTGLGFLWHYDGYECDAYYYEDIGMRTPWKAGKAFAILSPSLGIIIMSILFATSCAAIPRTVLQGTACFCFLCGAFDLFTLGIFAKDVCSERFKCRFSVGSGFAVAAGILWLLCCVAVLKLPRYNNWQYYVVASRMGRDETAIYIRQQIPSIQMSSIPQAESPAVLQTLCDNETDEGADKSDGNSVDGPDGKTTSEETAAHDTKAFEA